MKQNLFVTLILCAALLAGCQQAVDQKIQVKNPNTLDGMKNMKFAKLQFLTDAHNFGTIKSGDVVTYDFHFKNIGDAVLVIDQVVPSCGCTSPTWTKEPVAPGDSGIIHVKFDSHGKNGHQAKTATVVANTYPAETPLHIFAEVH